MVCLVYDDNSPNVLFGHLYNETVAEKRLGRPAVRSLSREQCKGSSQLHTLFGRPTAVLASSTVSDRTLRLSHRKPTTNM